MKAIPDDIHRFLVECVDSVEQLEVLLLLYRERDVEWTADAVAQRLYSQPSSIAGRLAALRKAGLLAHAGHRYRYEPSAAVSEQLVVRLAALYRERRVAVVTAIASKPMKNVQAFADAFRLRKRDEER